MPKFLFYSGTAFCLFVALSSAAAAWHALDSGSASFIAVGTVLSWRAASAILVALIAGLAVAIVFVRMAALVAARNLFAAFVALVSVTAAMASLVWVLMVEARMLRSTIASAALGEVHLAGVLMLGYFVSLTMLALRPYFRIQASRTLSALVFLPLPLMLLIVVQELMNGASAAMPAATPALIVFFAIHAVLFFAIAVHCVRHRYLFLEMTNLRQLLEPRVDPAARPSRRPIGGVAFDS